MLDPLLDRRGFLISSTKVSCGALFGIGRLPALAGAREQLAHSPGLIVHSESPLNAEPAAADLLTDWITPTKLFYVRNHAATPRLDAATFRIRITGLVQNELELSVAELRERFPAATTVATLICAGSRRSELAAEKPIAGVPWGVGPIGNAEWTGAPLADVLRAAGVTAEAKHVWFESVDRVEKDGNTFAFGASVPLAKAMSHANATPGVLLAWSMNGEPLTPEHGFPLRAIVPGYIGARSVKWLGQIVVSDRPNPNYFVSRAYKIYQHADDDLKNVPPLMEYPINAAICSAEPTRERGQQRMLVRGYALPPGVAGRTIARVEISSDGGVTWWTANFLEPAKDYCWRLWEAQLPVFPKTTELIARATDSSGATQPPRPRWNIGGYLCNSWHRVPIR